MKVGDIIEKGATSIPPEVLAFSDRAGDVWERGIDHDSPTPSDNEWLCIGVGYTDATALKFAPLTVTKVAEPAPSPLVLSLPEVPKEAVALVVRDGPYAGRRYIPEPGTDLWRMADAGGALWRVRDLLHTHGDLDIETAPPREPRTWPKLDRIEDEPERVTVSGQGAWHRDADAGAYTHDTEPVGFYSFIDLREMGDVTEVLD